MSKNENSTDPAAAARAARLREQIKDLVTTPAGSEQSRRSTGAGPEISGRKLSPNEFVQRRMQELDAKK